MPPTSLKCVAITAWSLFQSIVMEDRKTLACIHGCVSELGSILALGTDVGCSRLGWVGRAETNKFGAEAQSEILYPPKKQVQQMLKLLVKVVGCTPTLRASLSEMCADGILEGA